MVSHTPQNPPDDDIVRAYHNRTKHRFEAYAQGPGQLDWDAQPAPFRHYHGAPILALPLAADHFDRPWQALNQAPPTPVVPDLNTLGALLELAFGLSAWKTWGPSRWALRCNPSSGNLHPVEAYVLSSAIPGLGDGLHHYDPENHCLENRALLASPGSAPWLAVGLSSVMWREAWKYGERAFRYCQLDVGHAMAALRYAAQLLGWQVHAMAIPHAALAHCLGLDRSEDFPPSRYGFTEAEEPEILLALAGPGLSPPPAELPPWLAPAHWQGQPSTIDPAPGYRWPLIDQVAQASRDAGQAPALEALPDLPSRPAHRSPQSVAQIIRQRRSGQRFNPRCTLAKAYFYTLLDGVLPRPCAPWDSLSTDPAIHLLLFVLRVDGLPTGLYLLPRSPVGAEQLPQATAKYFPQQGTVKNLDPDCPAHLGLILLEALPLPELQRLARALSCHQDIAATSAFSLAMVAKFDGVQGSDYRDLLREAGTVGQALYLEAEAAGVRGTGIGCFFDDPVHQAFGLNGSGYQSLYHFTVGTPIVDERIETGPPYPNRVTTISR